MNRWGVGMVQEIDSAAMHVWFNWQHLELDVGDHLRTDGRLDDGRETAVRREDLSPASTTSISSMAGGVIFF